MTLNDKFAYESMIRALEDRSNKAVVLLTVNEADAIDMQSLGVDNVVGLWTVLMTHVIPLTDAIMRGFTPEQRARVPFVLPTQEQVQDVAKSGLIIPFRGRQ